MLEALITGVKYGLTGAATCGTFLVGAIVLAPFVMLVMNIVTAILNIGAEERRGKADDSDAQ